jgi:RNA polymerase subunit RPABC4/transcription elongation factor Spt4
MIYSNPFYIKDNGNGYSLYQRDAICEKCHRVIDRQEKYESYMDFDFTSSEKREYKFCPYCGAELGK